MSASERPRPDRKASTASGLEGDLRCESTLEASSACAGVRWQVDTRYSSTAKGSARLAEQAAAAAVVESRVVGRWHWWRRNERSVTVVRGRKEKGRCCFWTGSMAAGAGAGGEARGDAEEGLWASGYRTECAVFYFGL